MKIFDNMKELEMFLNKDVLHYVEGSIDAECPECKTINKVKLPLKTKTNIIKCIGCEKEIELKLE